MCNMKIAKKVDFFGRVAIPKEYRDILEIKAGTDFVVMNLNEESNVLMLGKLEDSCVFCRSKKNLAMFKNKLICRECCDKFYEDYLTEYCVIED